VNLVDLAIVVALLLAVLDGWRSGFVRTVFALLTWVVSIALAFVFHGPLATLLADATGLTGPATRAIAFIAVLFAAETAFAAIGRYTVAPLLRRVRAHRTATLVDRAAGVLPSVARAVMIVAIALAALVVLPVAPELRTAVDQSRIGSALVAEVAALQPRLEQLLGTDDEGLLFVTKLSADDQQRLQLPDDLALSSDPDAERQLFELVNQERQAAGLRLLGWDPRLVPVGRAHAEEMFRLRYFGHVSPNTGTPFDRLSRARIGYQRAGENLAYAQSVAVAHRGLMESEGHRANILRPEFTHLGIGVVNAGLHGRMFVQLFLTP
jgi:uncharacterized protein YkwD/uncharacterized membrane protein required for colicin V production